MEGRHDCDGGCAVQLNQRLFRSKVLPLDIAADAEPAGQVFQPWPLRGRRAHLDQARGRGFQDSGEDAEQPIDILAGLLRSDEQDLARLSRDLRGREVWLNGEMDDRRLMGGGYHGGELRLDIFRAADYAIRVSESFVRLSPSDVIAGDHCRTSGPPPEQEGVAVRGNMCDGVRVFEEAHLPTI